MHDMLERRFPVSARRHLRCSAVASFGYDPEGDTVILIAIIALFGMAILGMRLEHLHDRIRQTEDRLRHRPAPPADERTEEAPVTAELVLVSPDLGPGMVPIGWAEKVLEQAMTIDDPAV